MRLSRVRIEKFRAIRLVDIEVGSQIALVGQNSGGKSTILRALNAFFNFDEERQAFEEGRHSFQKTSQATVQLEFTNVPAACTLPRITLAGDTVKARLKFKKAAIWEFYVNGNWVIAPADFHENLRTHINYVYIPIARSAEALGPSSDSVLQRAVHLWIKEHTKNRDKITPKVAEAAKIVKERTLNGLSRQLRELTHIGGDFQFDLDFSRTPDYSILLNDLVLRVVDAGVSVDIADCGSGTQSLAAIGLYSYLAQSAGTTYILGLEEPEQNLHPQAQRNLLSVLESLPLQVLFTTHSTVLLDKLEHEQVILCRKIKSSTRGFEVTATQLNKVFWESNGLDREKYYTFHRRRNSEFFFADFVVVTESPIDSEVVSYIFSRSDSGDVLNGVSIVSLDGVDSIPYIWHLLKALNIRHFCIVDKDYFLPYLNDELAISRGANGFPRYKREFQPSCLVNKIIPDADTRIRLLDLFHSNHSQAMKLLESYNFFSFRFSMEIDLVASTAAREVLFDSLPVAIANRSSQGLLVNHTKQLKKLTTVIGALKKLNVSNFPNSYNRIRTALPKMIRNGH